MAPIEACEIMLNWGDDDVESDDGYGSDDVDMEIARTVRSWIRRALQCQVQSLRVDIQQERYSYIPMRNRPLVSRHLTRLELSGLWFHTGSSCLNLSGCPALEHLEITYRDLEDLIKVTSPSVKRLVIAHCSYYCEFDRLQICFPHLVSLWLEHFYDKTLVLESMPQLAVAYVSIDHYRYKLHDIPKCMILQGLAEAKHLVLLPDDKTVHIN
jgi:hypothetical protein